MRTMTVELVELEDQTTWVRHEGTMVLVSGAERLFDAAALLDSLRGGVAFKHPAPEPTGTRPLRTGKEIKAEAQRAKESEEEGEEAVARRRSKIDPVKLVEAKRLFEKSGCSIRLCAEQTGINHNTLYGIAVREKWQKL